MRRLNADGTLTTIVEPKAQTGGTGKFVADKTATSEYHAKALMDRVRGIVALPPVSHPVTEWGHKALAEGHPVKTSAREPRATR